MVDKESQTYQHLLWRKEKNDPIQEYKLTTVTFGTTSAPFLAVGTLMEIAKECEYESIGRIIRDDFYMDDLLTVSDSLQRCCEIKSSISQHTSKYGFHLRKCSNNEEIVPMKDAEKENETINLKEKSNVKTLRLQWTPKEDELLFTISEAESTKYTKRKALSYLAKIFDPLGLLTLVVITAKLFIQYLWLLPMDWDEKLDVVLEKRWLETVGKISDLQNLKIPRWLMTKDEENLQFLGFADASEKAASSSSTIEKVIEIVRNNKKVFAWSGSTITLAWIENNNSKDKFVRTRVSAIRKLVPEVRWNYVKSQDNPADLGTRGVSFFYLFSWRIQAAKPYTDSKTTQIRVSPDKIIESEMWWKGPSWLSEEEDE
ncbi:uncharacterized protein LOC142235402 [Haematobia irritans]|uniref:uncharacterized protein LOC142235402 n=1 Tax=Haematobia irritans TaxID=7368 RepID=UPI003F507DDB